MVAVQSSFPDYTSFEATVVFSAPAVSCIGVEISYRPSRMGLVERVGYPRKSAAICQLTTRLWRCGHQVFEVV